MLGVISVLLLAVCLCVGCNNLESDRPDSQLPVRHFAIDVDTTALPQFLSTVEKLAIRHEFEYRIASVRPDGEHFIVEMAKPEFRVIIVNPLDSGTFKVTVYENTIRPFPAEAADAFLADLRQSVSTVAGVRLPTPSTLQ